MSVQDRRGSADHLVGQPQPYTNISTQQGAASTLSAGRGRQEVGFSRRRSPRRRARERRSVQQRRALSVAVCSASVPLAKSHQHGQTVFFSRRQCTARVDAVAAPARTARPTASSGRRYRSAGLRPAFAVQVSRHASQGVELSQGPRFAGTSDAPTDACAGRRSFQTGGQISHRGFSPHVRCCRTLK